MIQTAVKLQRRWERRWPASAEQALEEAKAEGLSVLGLGGQRICLRAERDDQVLKAAWQEKGLVDNLLEWRLWQRAEPKLRRLLCPSLALEEAGILRQARCLPAAPEALGSRAGEICLELARHGISDCHVNLGLLVEPQDGSTRVVCYDYNVLRPRLARELLLSRPGKAGSEQAP